MWKLAALLLVAFVKYSSAVCACYESANYTGRSAPLSNPYDTDDFSACYTPCSYVAFSGDDSYGWTDLTFNWGTTTGSGGLLEIFDGPVASGTPLIQLQEGENVLSGSTKSQIKSSSPRITIKYSQNGSSTANVYYGVIKAVPGLQPSTVPVTTTTVPSTTPYTGTIFKKNPALITHDLLVVINQRTNGGAAALRNLNAIAINFVMLLSTTFDMNSASKTRLSLATLTPYDPYYAMRGAIWGMNSSLIMDNLPYSGISTEGNIDIALTGLTDLVFKVNTNSSTDSRGNVQRSVILLTGEWPSTGATLSNNVKTKFDSNGVNLLVVGFNLTTDEQSQLLRTDNRWYNAINTQLTNGTALASFVNPFYLNDGSDSNYWCPPHPIIPSTDGTFSWFTEPYNYDGPYGIQDWNGFLPYYGQNKRYCNFANNLYTYNMPSDGSNKLKVQVFFELEAGKDFLNFYDSSNNLIASYTGYDISASTFFTTTTTLTAQFISDNQSVFRGFYVSITPQTV